MKIWGIVLLLFITAIGLGGCLSDQVTGPVVVARPVYPPNNVYYRVLDPTDLQIRWTRSVSDTQLNFKGYFVELYRSTPYISVNDQNSEDSLLAEVDSFIVAKTATGSIDTSHIFTEAHFSGRYTAQVAGLRYSPQNAKDSLVQSDANQFISFYFDATPVVKPTALYASSASPTSVNLLWTHSVSEKDLGFAGYSIYYNDPTRPSVPEVFLAKVGKDTSTSTLQQYTAVVPGNPTPGVTGFLEYPWQFIVKSIRQDSVESDSIVITWSGAEQVPGLTATLDTGIFLTVQSGTSYVFGEGDLSQNSSLPVLFKIHYDGSSVSLIANGSTTFDPQVDTASSFAGNYFSAPIPDAAYSATSVTLPPITSGGAVVYALFPNLGRGRILISAVNGSYVSTANVVVISGMSFQPLTTTYKYF